MGNPKDPSDPVGDAVSLRSNLGGGSNTGLDPLLDDGDDDVPQLGGSGFGEDEALPLYSDVADPSGNAAEHSINQTLLRQNPPTSYYVEQNPTSPRMVDQNTGTECYMDRLLDTDPKRLENHVLAWATRPPRIYVQVQGTHQQSVERNGKKEHKKTVTDFDVSVELTPYIFSDATNRASWRELRTVDNGEKARRGTVFRRRAPGAKQSIELGDSPKPSLQEWCHMYCASHAGLKSFVLQRRVTGLDQDLIRERLERLVRASNYRGHLKVKFPVVDERVEVYNECATNRWRLLRWLRIVFYITLLFLLVWPYLFFRTKRYEVVVVEWPFSRPGRNGQKEYVSISEEQWYNMWGRAIHKAVLEKRQGVLDQMDLMNSQGAEPTFNLGSGSGAMGLLRAGVNAMNEVNRQLGWGGDQW